MRISVRKAPILLMATFLFGACQAASGLEGIPKWLKQSAYVMVGGLAATGLMKAEKKTEEKPPAGK